MEKQRNWQPERVACSPRRRQHSSGLGSPWPSLIGLAGSLCALALALEVPGLPHGQPPCLRLQGMKAEVFLEPREVAAGWMVWRLASLFASEEAEL